MVKSYDVFWDGQAVGTAAFEKEGLYWKIHCRCDLPDGVPYCITLKAGEQIDMGLLVQEEDGLCLTKRIAMKRIGDAQPSFVVMRRDKKTQTQFKAIEPNEPFDYLENLKESRLEEQDGKLGIMLSKEDPGPQIQGSDPTQEYPDGSAPEQFDHPDP